MKKGYRFKIRNDLKMRVKQRRKTIRYDNARWNKTLEQSKNRMAVPPESFKQKTSRMYRNLIANGWSFIFKTEAVSPRGYRYVGQGATSDDAFLSAFRLVAFSDLIPKIPKIMKSLKKVSRKAEASVKSLELQPMQATTMQGLNEKRSYQKTKLKDLLMRYGKQLINPNETEVDSWPKTKAELAEYRFWTTRPIDPIRQIYPILPPSGNVKLDHERAYRRLYMRAYRNRKRFPQFAEAA